MFCGTCKAELKGGTKHVVFNGKLLHPECFVCSTCKEPLDRLYERDGQPFCSKHYIEQPESTNEDGQKTLEYEILSIFSKKQLTSGRLLFFD